MKSYGVTIQTKRLEHCFLMALFISEMIESQRLSLLQYYNDVSAENKCLLFPVCCFSDIIYCSISTHSFMVMQR